MALIYGDGRRPFSKEPFGKLFRDAWKAACVAGSAPTGLSKLAAIRAAQKGASTAQIRALFGWTTDAMPSLCTRAAERTRLALEGAMLAMSDKRTSIPSPSDEVRALGPKGK